MVQDINHNRVPVDHIRDSEEDFVVNKVECRAGLGQVALDVAKVDSAAAEPEEDLDRAVQVDRVRAQADLKCCLNVLTKTKKEF
jgi:hypothetical protein